METCSNDQSSPAGLDSEQYDFLPSKIKGERTFKANPWLGRRMRLFAQFHAAVTHYANPMAKWNKNVQEKQNMKMTMKSCILDFHQRLILEVEHPNKINSWLFHILSQFLARSRDLACFRKYPGIW